MREKDCSRTNGVADGDDDADNIECDGAVRVTSVLMFGHGFWRLRLRVLLEETRETGFVECRIGLGEAVDGTEKEGEAMEE